MMPDTFLIEEPMGSDKTTRDSLAPAPSTPLVSTHLTPEGMELPWETLSAMIQGRSSIDLTSMPVTTREEAQELIYHYGFDLDLPEDRAEIEGYFVEAVNFIEHRFLTRSIDWAAHDQPLPPAERIPISVTSSRNVIDLMLTASQKDHPNRPWACALLKVMHTLVFIQNSPLYKHHAQASETILARFRDVLLPESDGTVMLQGATDRHLKLYAFEAKHHKPRESILLKLLCKKENVAENVWDLVGVRLVTFHPAQAILAVDILREQKVILFPNVIPSRSRNTLIDFEHFRTLYETEMERYRVGQKSVEAMQKLFETDAFVLPEETHASQNPLSSLQYRSLHITCRQLLRLKSPGVKLPHDANETRFAFPYEIQILDKASYLESKVGEGAHAKYKLRQLFAARRRVLGRLLETKNAEPTP